MCKTLCIISALAIFLMLISPSPIYFNCRLAPFRTDPSRDLRHFILCLSQPGLTGSYSLNADLRHFCTSVEETA